MHNALQNYSAYDEQSAWTLGEEQVKSLYNSLPISLLSSMVIALILSLSHWKIIGQAEIILWNLLLGSTLIARLTLWIFWQNTWQLYSVQFWLWSFRIGVWLSGAAWGSTAILLFAEGNSIYQALLSFSLAGVAAGSTTSLAADKYSSLGFVIFGISPLSVVIFLEEGPTAIAMSGMTLLFILFVLTSSSRTRRNMEEQIQKNQHLLQLTQELNEKQQLERIINKAQSIFISENDIKSALHTLLHDSLTASNSTLGFISQVDRDSSGKPFIRALVFSSTLKNQRTFEKFREANFTENGAYRDLDQLLDTIMQSGKMVVINNPGRDVRAENSSGEHSDINNLLGIPIFSGREQVAILGLANSPSDYQPEHAKKLEPILKTIAQFVQTMNHEQRHAQDRAALEANTQRTQTILNDIADGIITIDKQGIVHSFNHAAETIFGYRARQIIGKNVSELMPSAYKSIHNDYLRDHFANNKKNAFGIGREILGLRRNGQEFPMDLMVSRVFQNGEPVFIGIVRDITDKKRADELRYQFIASASKEILAPLNLISEAIQNLKNKEQPNLPDPAKNLIDIAHSNSLRLQQLIHDLIEIQSLSKDETALKYVITPVLPLIEDAVRRNKALGEINQTKAVINANPGILMVNVDVTRFNQAMTQLLQFAFKCSPPNADVTIRISEERSRIKINMGFINECLSQEQHKKLFSHFLNAPSNSKTELPEISDLGLAIAKEIIAKMRGTIATHDEAGRYYFLIEFPQAVEEEGGTD